MENTTQTPELNLSPAEIEMIKVKREKEELAAREREAQKKIDCERKIQNEKRSIEEFKTRVAAKIVATRAFLSQLNLIAPGAFELVIKELEQLFKCEDHTAVPDEERPGRTKFVAETLFREMVKYDDVKIKHTVSGQIIEIEEHITYGARSSGRKNHGYKMKFQYDTKYYSVAKTVVNHINEDQAKKYRQAQAEQSKATAKEQALTFLTKEYPEAKVEHGEKYNPSYSNGRISNGYTTHFYKVTFANGICFKFTYDLNGPEKTLRISYYGNDGINDANIGQVITLLKGI